MKFKINAGWVVQGEREGSRPRTKDDGRSSQESRNRGTGRQMKGETMKIERLVDMGGAGSPPGGSDPSYFLIGHLAPVCTDASRGWYKMVFSQFHG